jgi:hypothetical protein
LDEV